MKLQFTGAAISIDAAESSEPRITGIAVPYNVTASVSTGQTVKLLAGSMPASGRMPRLLLEHDTSRVVGVVDQRQDTPDGMLFSARIADTAEGRDLVALLKMGALDSVSVNIQATEFEYEGKVLVVKAAQWDELSVVYEPAFAGAQITQVAASQAEDDSDTEADEPQPDNIPEEEPMSEQTPAVEASAEIVPTTPIFAAARKHVELPTAAEYIAAAIAGGDAWHQMSEALRAAAPDVLTTDTPGILPVPIVAPVYNNFRGIRPVVDAIGPKAMPSGGKVFIRPEVTTHTSMAAQSAENAALQSGTFVVYNNQVTKATYGGYVNISMQDLEWTDPAVINLILDDMARIYANTTDNVAADNLVSGASVTAVLADADLDDPAKWTAFIYGAGSTILSGSNGNLPNHLFLSPDMWVYLGALSDTAGRPLFPQVGPMNAFGTLSPGSTDAVAFGLRVVVDRNFASGTIIVGDGSGFEIFEQQRGALSLESPSTLSRTLSWHGNFATLMIDASKFVKRTAS